MNFSAYSSFPDARHQMCTCIHRILERHTELLNSPSDNLRVLMDLGKLSSQILILNKGAYHATFQAITPALLLAS